MADAFTISLLPMPLALVHIPRSRLQELSHPILRHILDPSPTFFTITANEIEISLFVDYEHVHDFDVIARKDMQKMRRDPVEISYQPWNALQIDSHAEQYGGCGARVNELSAPLAAAGISILYQSSYMCDFIFVREARLHEVLTLFETAGFDMYTSETFSSSTPSIFMPNSHSRERENSITSSPTVLTLTQNSILASQSRTPSSISITPHGHPHMSSREDVKILSPTADEVRVLDSELACVGLSEEFGVDSWGMKIVKLVAFPELIFSFGRKDSKNTPDSDFSIPSSCQSLDPEEGEHRYPPYSSYSGPTVELSSTTHDHESSPAVASSGPRSRVCSDGSLFSIDTNTSSDNSSESKMTSPSTPSSSIHEDELLEKPQKERSSSPSPLTVPFFSFIRTQEGSSLTTDVKVLSTLFPPEQRHLLVCGGSLELGVKLDEGYGVGSDEGDEISDDDDGADMSIGELKCLQVDLRRFGLDKYGLVNRFSKTLGDHNVNHLYSSTFKSANILVNRKHVMRAHSLLRGC
ncbi:hypothetical protein AGABI1DRAFT_106212 [Agaricus bisporus var. burnettii JB137-S8]|uniref:CASTOR ACT domain-containing protein n=1 Tax=Agaricus bisporus var. burnettii (strain JB137-S8 / ATCC MYA-4627 / FGSC 10392) TaxID=597362 RepID=K5X9G3_AGABU|nr:uncharacterized protein AGABI1DRAFT_106212 [Agaricus bisporus var. burnettii JB137-S8]EKM79868.1 hypothetical protein AGABI1DRAFT_106212 [Agaricus bisporus var. burnettii JB137-S8]